MNEDETQFYTNISAMEPLFPDDPSGELERLAEDLLKKSSSLSDSLHPLTREAIADFLRPMNSYYSNLIEGHDTHPIDIEKALKEEYSTISKNRTLQLEAKAHINLHKLIYDQFKHSERNPYDIDFIKSIHYEFYKHLPENFKSAKRKDGTTIKIIPGEFRDCEVQVGSHIGPYSKYLSAFMRRFEEFYAPGTNTNKSKIRRIISIAASHHRLAWIHPFIDGNGRVIRLFGDACFMSENLHASGLWSMSRGLARREKDYKLALALADSQRWNDYDGRGNLSNRELVNFCRFFLTTAIDQIEYMSSILNTDNMLNRIHKFVDLMVANSKLKNEARYVLEAVFLKGKVSKSEIERITGKSDKTARNIAVSLLSMGLLKMENATKFSAYLVNYPISFSTILISGLYPNSKEIDLLNNILK
jgi:Fic family protein